MAKNKNHPTWQTIALSASFAAVLAACGGGGGGSDTASSPTTSSSTLKGTAAIGAPVDGVVMAIDVNGKVSPAATTSALGAYTVDVSGMTAPFILRIVGTSGGQAVTLNSIATAAGQTVNITPLTDLIVSSATGQPAGTSLATLCTPTNNVVSADCLTALGTAVTGTRLTDAVNAVKTMIAPLNTGNIDPLNGSFVADGTGLDKVLDQILVEPATALGSMATVTLIATNQSLGTVALPSTTGGTATATTGTVPTTNDLALANAAATILPEIQACLNSFSALYATTLPASSAVLPFVDSSLKFGTYDAAGFVNAFSSTSPVVDVGFKVKALGLAPADMSPFTNTEIGNINVNTGPGTVFRSRTSTAITTDNAGNPTAAWVKARFNSDAGLNAIKMVKGAAYSGCAGGWKLAGSQHLDMHMDARVSRNPNGTITREWPMHVESATLTNAVTGATGAVKVRVNGPGLSLYDSTAINGVGASTAVTWVAGAGASMTLPLSGTSLPNRAGYYPAGTDSIQSCQDLKAAGVAQPTGGDTLPCMDESQTAPGKVYFWSLMDTNNIRLAVFPFQINAVPLSKAFVAANADSIFATITSKTPATLADFSTNTSLIGSVTFNYTKSNTYGAKMEHCGIILKSGGGAGTLLLAAEQRAVGQETSCTFNTPSALVSTYTVNSTPAFGLSAAPDFGNIRAVTTVLGNQAGASINLQ